MSGWKCEAPNTKLVRGGRQMHWHCQYQPPNCSQARPCHQIGRLTNYSLRAITIGHRSVACSVDTFLAFKERTGQLF